MGAKPQSCYNRIRAKRICGGASFREERLTLAERGKMDVFKINDDDDDDDFA